MAATDIDFIRSDDPSVAFQLLELGRHRKEMPDKRANKGDDDLFMEDVLTFRVDYVDGTKVEVWAVPQLGGSADHYAMQVAEAMGKLPHALRACLKHVVIHLGDESAFAEEGGGFFVLYSKNIDTRLANNDLEETVFHESIHVALEAEHANSVGWIEAQKNDRTFITEYAQGQPKKEDLPEFALFAYTFIHHPERVPVYIKHEITQNMPNRLKYMRHIFAAWESHDPWQG